MQHQPFSEQCEQTVSVHDLHFPPAGEGDRENTFSPAHALGSVPGPLRCASRSAGHIGTLPLSGFWPPFCLCERLFLQFLFPKVILAYVSTLPCYPTISSNFLKFCLVAVLLQKQVIYFLLYDKIFNHNYILHSNIFHISVFLNVLY